MKIFKDNIPSKINLDILACSNGIYKGDVLFMKKKDSPITNGFRNGTVIFLVVLIFAILSHFLGNL